MLQQRKRGLHLPMQAVYFLGTGVQNELQKQQLRKQT